MARSTDPALDALLQGIERELPRAVALRRRLHAAPELAHAERQTSASVAAELPVTSQEVAGTGRIARVDPADGASSSAELAAPVAVRAELDGLPMRERTGAPFAASGEVMHAC